jgi:nucleoside-diphosphate-sugar epimerase
MTTLITGADGYLGWRIAAALAPHEELILAVRAPETKLLPGSAPGEVIAVDLRDADPFAGVDTGRITRIIHAAANIRFAVDRRTAQRVNVDGTAHVRRLAGRCDNLERLTHLSTLYTAGRRRGDITEIRHTDAGFVNHYEWSKWAAEEVLLESAGLPVVVLRLPTVIGEDGSGEIGQYNAFHHTLKLYYRGLLTLLPGEPATPLSLATAEFTVGAVTALLDAQPGIYQVCAGAVPLGTAIDTAFAVFDRDEAFRRRRLPRPLPCDRESFHDLVCAARGLRGGPLHGALGSVAPFAEQLYLPKVFRTDRLRGAWPGYRTHDPAALVASVCARLIEGGLHAAA